MFNLIMVILLFAMMAGTIIDQLAKMREKVENDKLQKDNFCFICGNPKDKIEKQSKK